MLKNFNNFINEGMGYTNFFGKKVSHEEALQKRTRDLITQIVVDVAGISEKSFTQYDQVIENVKDMCDRNPEIYKKSEEYYSKGKRLEYFAEKIYDKYFNSPKLNETSLSNPNIENETDDVDGKVNRSKKLTKEMKEKILPLLISGQT